MASMTSYLEKKLLDHMLGISSFTMPTTVYASLHTASPGQSGSLTNEVSSTSSGYGRVAITAKMNATDPVSGISVSNAIILYGPATINWGTINYIAISDALSGGNMLMYGALTIAQTTPIGESVQFSVGQFIVQFS
jgi:hypothetical protein